MMTSKSKRFRILEQELKKLRKYFLPRQFDPQGNYSERQIALATAYLVLAHAEIESYLEDRVLDLARSAVKIWKEKKKTTQVLVYLFAFSGLTLDKPPDSVTPDQPSKSKALQEKLKFDEKRINVSKSFEYLVIHNHGIKEKNLLSLLLPIGINSDDLDKVWLQEMKDFGAKRGQFAHQSASKLFVI